MSLLKKVLKNAENIVFLFVVGGAIFLCTLESINKFKQVSQDTKDISTLLKNSQKEEYIVKEGEDLYSIRNKFFQIGENEFSSLDNRCFAQNQGTKLYGGYKSLTTTNIWTSIVRKENNLPWTDILSHGMYFVAEGETLKVPVRKYTK